MNHRLELCALFVFILAGGVWTPPAVLATEYLLLTAEEEGTRGQVYQMDEEGYLFFKQEYAVGWDTHNITVSPDGRVVIFSSWASPMLSVFFPNEQSSLAPPIYLNHPFGDDYYTYDPVAFHHSLPMFYVGFYPMASYQYSLAKHTVERTSQTMELNIDSFPTYHMGCSSWSNSLVFLQDNVFSYTIQTVLLDEIGLFSKLNPPLKLPTGISSDFAVSPDGRWATATTTGQPQLQFIRINQDGSAELTQGLNFAYNDLNNYIKAVFTPDSQSLLLVGGGEHILSLYAINRTQGTLALRSWVSRESPGYNAYPPECLAVSPDGQFVAFTAQSNKSLSQYVIYLARIHNDGTLEYLHGKEVAVDHFISALALVALPPKNAAQAWGMYE